MYNYEIQVPYPLKKRMGIATMHHDDFFVAISISNAEEFELLRQALITLRHPNRPNSFNTDELDFPTTLLVRKDLVCWFSSIMDTEGIPLEQKELEPISVEQAILILKPYEKRFLDSLNQNTGTTTKTSSVLSENGY